MRYFLFRNFIVLIIFFHFRHSKLRPSYGKVFFRAKLHFSNSARRLVAHESAAKPQHAASCRPRNNDNDQDFVPIIVLSQGFFVRLGRCEFALVAPTIFEQLPMILSSQHCSKNHNDGCDETSTARYVVQNDEQIPPSSKSSFSCRHPFCSLYIQT